MIAKTTGLDKIIEREETEQRSDHINFVSAEEQGPEKETWEGMVCEVEKNY